MSFSSVVYEDFKHAIAGDGHTPVPDDWTVVICDIESSTAAIRQGNYKSVNLVSAAAIMAVTNLQSEPNEIPYVFGGDGATFLVPPKYRERAIEVLVRCRTMGRAIHGLELRVAAIPVARLRTEGEDVRLGWFRLSPTLLQPVLSGGGLLLAERWTKDPAIYAEFAAPEFLRGNDANLEGLECRWEPIPSQRGDILSLIVFCRHVDSEAIMACYREITEKILEIYPEANPVSVERLKLSSRFRTFRQEAAVKFHAKSAWVRELSALIAAVMTWTVAVLWKTVFAARGRAYKSEVTANTDFRRFDGVLRMVLDSSKAQTEKLEKVLGESADAGEIFFGIHKSPSALMTCLIFNRGAGEHLHLLDGAGGGLAEAALQLKEQRSRETARKVA